MDIEEALRQIDPVAGLELPEPDSLQGASIKARALQPTTPRVEQVQASRARRRLTVPLAVLIALAAVVILLIGLLPPHLTPGSSNAAAALDELASTAARQSTLGPGQYAYTQVEQQPTGITGVGPANSSAAYTEYSVGTVQTWIAADGSGRQVTTTDLNPRFLTPADESAWAKAGGKYQEPPSYVVTQQQFGPGGKGLGEGQFPQSRPTPYDVASLPTDPASLAKTLCDTQSWRTLPSRTANFGYPLAQPNQAGCPLFGITVTLLQGPDIGSTPALRQALFKVLADVHGVELVGERTDAAGRRGTELRMVDRQRAGTTKFTCVNANVTPRVTTTVEVHHPAMATTYTLIVDPSNATLLSLERSFFPSKVAARSIIGCIAPHSGGDQKEEQIPDRTVLLSAGVVNSTQATAKGTVQGCAAGSTPMPPWNICKGSRSDGDR